MDTDDNRQDLPDALDPREDQITRLKARNGGLLAPAVSRLLLSFH